jgi:hypothetical protein
MNIDSLSGRLVTKRNTKMIPKKKYKKHNERKIG